MMSNSLKPEDLEGIKITNYLKPLEEFSPFVPKIAVVSQVVNSDQFQLIKNDSLKNALAYYVTSFNGNYGGWDYSAEYWLKAQAPYVDEHLNRLQLLKIDAQFAFLPESRFEMDVVFLQDDPKFENIVSTVYWLMSFNHQVLVKSANLIYDLQEIMEDLFGIPTD